MKAVWKHRLMVGCLIGATLVCSGEPLQPNAVLRDPAWVLHVDVDALRSTAIGQMILRELDKPEEQARFALYKVLLSFDPRQELHGVTLYGATAVPEDAVALVYADFDPAHLAHLAGMAEDARSTTNGQQVIHSWVDGKRRDKEGGEPRIYAAIYGTKVVIFGQKEQRVAKALGALDGSTPALNLNEWFPKLATGGGTSVIQGAARKLELKGSEPRVEILRQAKGISLTVGEQEDRIIATLGLEADSVETGGHIAALARGLLALLALQKDSPEAVKLAQNISVSEAGVLTMVRLALPTEEIIQAVQRLRPPVPPYPWWGDYGSEAGVTQAARDWSAGLEQYIKDWLDGRAPAEIPSHLIPECQRNDTNYVGFRLVRPEEITADEQWIKRYSLPAIDVNDAYGEFWDPHATYGLMNWMFLPFGSKVILEGEFPHCRYFSLQVSHAFDPKAYVVGPFGAGEVAWVDADIEPLPGHINPFRVGADRNATKRSFRVEATATVGDPTLLDAAAWKPGTYRDPGNNHRHCSGLNYTGPWGDPGWKPADKGYTGGKEGRFSSGTIWLRMYGLDHAYRPQGGVSFPKVTYQLPDGRKYFIAVDFTKVQAHFDRTRALVRQAPSEMNNPGVGWGKMMSILRSIGNGLAGAYDPHGLFFSNEYLRNFFLGVEGRGEGQPGVRGLQPAATCCVHIDYLNRGISLGAGKVAVVSGKLPTTPDTRNGAARMTAAQARCWSLTGYSENTDMKNLHFVPGVAQVSVMDDEIVQNASQEYVLVFSRPQDRPANATAANGVTWVDWGPEARFAFTLRWLTIKPEWSFPNSPTEPAIGYNADSAAASYNANLISRNNRGGYLGEYQPVIGNLTKAAFEAISGPITPAKIPAY